MRKLKSRLFSLFIPYLFWNLLVFFREFFTETFFVSMMAGNKKLYSESSFFEIIDRVFALSQEHPVDYQLWFIRDLMIIAIISPLIYYLVKKLHIYFIVLFLTICTIPGLINFSCPIDLRGIFYFSLGTWLAIRKIDFIEKIISKKFLLLIFYLIFLMTSLLTDKRIFHNLSIITGVITAVAYAGNGIKNKSLRVNTFLTSSSFYIYAYHGYIILLINKTILRLIPHNTITIIISYFASAILTILLGLLFYFLLRKYLPKFTAIICGSR